ncbi:helix-turn-helix transcriptional regulator [Mycobacteroides salmoniphilum]|uniref:helix-turn-helix transcriptional regulator n=1 Tax=Mycobacteroides salmoniphilum TaxID=404941 RepID=UPI002D21E436|nr:helix-turn-helix transcriptional regulator [Mycobacteroides salmoniphilum]
MQARTSVTCAGTEFVFATEQIPVPTDWFFYESHHVMVVHRHGRLRSMELEFENGPSGRTHPRVGDIWIIPANHRYSALAHGNTVKYCQLTLHPDALSTIDLKPAIRQRDPLTYQIVEQIGAVADREDVFARLATEWLTETMLLHLSNKLPGGPEYRPSLHRPLDETSRAGLIEYLDDSPDSMIGLPQLANQAGMAVREFTKAFVATFHTTPHQLLLHRRITRAKELLAHSARSITEISAALGFPGPEHFITAFEQRVGTTPANYRRGTEVHA